MSYNILIILIVCDAQQFEEAEVLFAVKIDLRDTETSRNVVEGDL